MKCWSSNKGFTKFPREEEFGLYVQERRNPLNQRLVSLRISMSAKVKRRLQGFFCKPTVASRFFRIECIYWVVSSRFGFYLLSEALNLRTLTVVHWWSESFDKTSFETRNWIMDVVFSSFIDEDLFHNVLLILTTWHTHMTLCWWQELLESPIKESEQKKITINCKTEYMFVSKTN